MERAGKRLSALLVFRIALINPAFHSLEVVFAQGVNAKYIWDFRHGFINENFRLPGTDIQVCFYVVVVCNPRVVASGAGPEIGHTRGVNNGFNFE